MIDTNEAGVATMRIGRLKRGTYKTYPLRVHLQGPVDKK